MQNSNSSQLPDNDGLGHHSGGGRNIVADSGRAGDDIFFAAVQMTRMPMVLCDPNQPDCPIIFCNRAFCEMTGYDEAEVLGRNCRFLQGAGTDRSVIRRIHDGIAAHRDIHEEIYNYRKDGGGFWNALFISPVFDPDGKLVYLFGSQLDVTRRKEAETLMLQSQRMEALGAMASGVAHEFNNLMTVVIGSIEQALAAATSDRQCVQLQRAEWGARRAGRLTAQLLSFARRQFLDDRIIDLNETLRGFDAMMQQIVGDRGRVVLDLADAPTAVRVDGGQLELALINLLRNAADASPQPAAIAVRTRVVAEDERGPMVELAIEDHGLGMSAQVAERATDPFFTTSPSGERAGLGLSMVHGWVTQTGGGMRIESRPGLGTTVRLFLPQHAATDQVSP